MMDIPLSKIRWRGLQHGSRLTIMKEFIISNYLFLLVLYSFSQEWVIEEMAPMPERVTNNAVAAGFINRDSFVFTFGGLDYTKKYSGIHLRSYKYNINMDQWAQIPSLPDTLGKIATSASRVGNIIYIMGGYYVFQDGTELSSNKVHRYNIENNRYLEDGIPIPLQIDDQVQAVWKDSLIYLITGWSDTENQPNVQIYNPALNSWMVGDPIPDNHQYKSFGASGVIIGDTIYYFGGAAYQKFYPAQNQLRIGVINPKDPSEIKWSIKILKEDLFGYRTAATAVNEIVYWIGGSQITYNYNGIAYNGTGGVEPSNHCISYNTEIGQWEIQSNLNVPMDLRNLAEISSTIKYIVGGIEKGQKVSNKILKLTLE